MRGYFESVGGGTMEAHCALVTSGRDGDSDDDDDGELYLLIRSPNRQSQVCECEYHATDVG